VKAVKSISLMLKNPFLYRKKPDKFGISSTNEPLFIAKRPATIPQMTRTGLISKKFFNRFPLKLYSLVFQTQHLSDAENLFAT